MRVLSAAVRGSGRRAPERISRDALNGHLARLRLTNVIPVKGLFQDSFPTLEPYLTFGLAHPERDRGVRHVLRDPRGSRHALRRGCR